MKKNYLLIALLLLSTSFLISCQKEISNGNNQDQTIIEKVKNWLDKKISITNPENSSKIELLKNNLNFEKLRFEDINRGERFIIIPVKDGVKSSFNNDKKSINSLVLGIDGYGSIRRGNFVQYIPENNQEEEIPSDIFNKFYNHQKIEKNFKLTYLTILDRPLWEVNYQNDGITGYSIAKKGAVTNSSGRGQEVCIEYYWQTYENGILVSEVYLGTICGPEVEEGSGSGGGGGGSTQNIDFSNTVTEDDPIDPAGAPTIVYTHNYTLQYVDNEVINVIRYPVTASPMVATYIGSGGRVTTRSLTLFGQGSSWTATSYNHGFINWWCFVFGHWVYTNGDPSYSQQWTHSNTTVY